MLKKKFLMAHLIDGLDWDAPMKLTLAIGLHGWIGMGLHGHSDYSLLKQVWHWKLSPFSVGPFVLPNLSYRSTIYPMVCYVGPVIWGDSHYPLPTLACALSVQDLQGLMFKIIYLSPSLARYLFYDSYPINIGLAQCLLRPGSSHWQVWKLIFGILAYWRIQII